MPASKQKIQRITRVYQALDFSQLSHTDVMLDEAASHYVGRVLRLTEGGALQLFDGNGQQCDAVIVGVTKKAVTVRLDAVSTPQRESPLHIELVQALSKGDRMDFTVQKAVELGAASIQPVFSERAMVNLKGERLTKKEGHWRQIMISACEQSWRNVLPPLQDTLPLNVWSENRWPAHPVLILDPNAEQGLRDFHANHAQLSAVTVVIGPEGGLSAAEVTGLRNQGAIPIRLGPRVLRTETAGVSIIAALQAMYGDLG